MAHFYEPLFLPLADKLMPAFLLEKNLTFKHHNENRSRCWNANDTFCLAVMFLSIRTE